MKVAQKMISLEKIKVFDTFTKIASECRRFMQISCGLRLWKAAQSLINRPIWSHWTRKLLWMWADVFPLENAIKYGFIHSHLTSSQKEDIEGKEYDGWRINIRP